MSQSSKQCFGQKDEDGDGDGGSGGNSGNPSKEDTRDCGLDCQLGVIVLAPPNQGDGGNHFDGIIFLHPSVQDRDSPLWFV